MRRALTGSPSSCNRLLFAALFLVQPFCLAQQDKGTLVAHRPEFYRLVNKNTTVDKISGAFEGTITEGPLWNPRGFLLFSDIYGDKIYRWNPDGTLKVFRDPGQYSNGLTYDRQGRLLICEQELRRLVRLEKDGTLSVLADRWEGKKLNCPNDIVVRKDGTIYFTDPYWKFPPGAVQELTFQAVFRITPEGKLSVEAKDFGLPNGIALAPDEKTLYVGDSRRAKVYALDVAADGSLSNQRLLADLKSAEKGAVDGLKVDELGNIWTTGPGGICVLDKKGVHLGTIRLPGPATVQITTFPGTTQEFANVPANCAWGDRDFRALYLTAPKSVYRVRTRVRGKSTYSLK